MKFLVGLGNPGSKYKNNRHNIGFMAVDAIADQNGFSPWRKKFQAEISDGQLGREKVLLIKPQTFMNLSGQAVGEAARFYKVEPNDIWVFHDELDIAPSKIRLKQGGGHGGHNGLKSCDAHLGKDYHRVRLGIGHPGDKARVNGHVLGDFAKVDMEWLEPLIEGIGAHADMLVADKNSEFMNKVALLVQGDKASEKPIAKHSKAHKPETQMPEASKLEENSAENALAAGLKKLFGRPQ